MAKGDDAVRRKRNKTHRKRMRNSESTVSARVASIIAAKHRRKAGKRRICEVSPSSPLFPSPRFSVGSSLFFSFFPFFFPPFPSPCSPRLGVLLKLGLSGYW